MNHTAELLPLAVIAPRGASEVDSRRAIACRRDEILLVQTAERARQQQRQEAEARERVAFRYD